MEKKPKPHLRATDSRSYMIRRYDPEDWDEDDNENVAKEQTSGSSAAQPLNETEPPQVNQQRYASFSTDFFKSLFKKTASQSHTARVDEFQTHTTASDQPTVVEQSDDKWAQSLLCPGVDDKHEDSDRQLTRGAKRRRQVGGSGGRNSGSDAGVSTNNWSALRLPPLPESLTNALFKSLWVGGTTDRKSALTEWVMTRQERRKEVKNNFARKKKRRKNAQMLEVV